MELEASGEKSDCKIESGSGLGTKLTPPPTPMQGGEPVLRTGMLVGGGC